MIASITKPWRYVSPLHSTTDTNTTVQCREISMFVDVFFDGNFSCDFF